MTTLIVGASGATGKFLVDQLLKAGHRAKIITRATSYIPEFWNNHKNVMVIREHDITDIHVSKIAAYLNDCDAVASCLGHNLSLKGIYGEPRKLVAETVQLLCEAIMNNASEKPIRFVLMNTAGNSNRDLNERVSSGEKIVIGLLRFLMPPHLDNEKAADYLRVKIGQDHPFIDWTVVRPDSLIDEESITAYSLNKSPIRSALFNPGKTSRINVAHFMAQLITDDITWVKWKGQMPVIYNEVTEPDLTQR